MTENKIWIGVSSNKKPKETNAFYNISEFNPPKSLVKMIGCGEELKWYQGWTYFEQTKALEEIANRYKDDLMFFAFTGFDSDLSRPKKWECPECDEPLTLRLVVDEETKKTEPAFFCRSCKRSWSTEFLEEE